MPEVVDMISALHDTAQGLSTKANAIENLANEARDLIAKIHGDSAVPPPHPMPDQLRKEALTLHAKADALAKLLKDGQDFLDLVHPPLTAQAQPAVPPPPVQPQQVGPTLPIHEQLVAERGDPDATVVLPKVTDDDVALPRPVDAYGTPVCQEDIITVIGPPGSPMLGRDWEVVNVHLVDGLSFYGVKEPGGNGTLYRVNGPECRLKKKAANG